MVSIGRHPNGVNGPTQPDWAIHRAENWYIGGTFAGLQLQRVSIRNGHIGEEQIHIPPGPYGPALHNG